MKNGALMGFHFVCGAITPVPKLKIALNAALLFSPSTVVLDAAEEAKEGTVICFVKIKMRFIAGLCTGLCSQFFNPRDF